MPNPGQPTIAPGATGDVVRRVQRALRRTPDLGLAVDGVFGPNTETAVRDFQEGAGLVVDGIVGPATWAALPDGSPMPTLKVGPRRRCPQPATGAHQRASGQWNTTPGAIDGIFGPNTKASVEAFQTWGGVSADGVVGDQTWAVSLHAASATLETAVGLQYVVVGDIDLKFTMQAQQQSNWCWAAVSTSVSHFYEFDQLVDTMRGCQHAAWSDRLLRRGRIGRMQCLRISGPGIAGSWTLRSFAKWDRNLSSFAE